VCGGDGHTEALQIQVDTSKMSYEDVMRVFFDEARGGCFGGAQYMSAVWTHSEEQAAICKKIAKERGSSIPIFPASKWYDAEGYHQKYYGGGSRGF
jgi:peptide-methionine (S)-S-oxide reductase